MRIIRTIYLNPSFSLGNSSVFLTMYVCTFIYAPYFLQIFVACPVASLRLIGLAIKTDYQGFSCSSPSRALMQNQLGFYWNILFFNVHSWPKMFSFYSMLLVTVTPFRKVCSPNQDLKNMYQNIHTFLTSLPVLVSELIKQIQDKIYNLEFGHFHVSLKIECFYF